MILMEMVSFSCIPIVIFLFSVREVLINILYIIIIVLIFIYYWMCNFPVTPHVFRSVGWVVGRS